MQFDLDCLGEPIPQPQHSVLFDFKTEVTVVAPVDLKPDQDEQICESALATVVSHALFGHEPWWGFRWSLYYHSRQEFFERPPECWNTEEPGRRKHTFDVEIEGIFVNIPMRMDGCSTVHETTKYHGCVGQSKVILEYEISTYLSPTVLNGLDLRFFDKHNFYPVSFEKAPDALSGNLCSILEVHKERASSAFNHNLAWALALDNISSVPFDNFGLD